MFVLPITGIDQYNECSGMTNFIEFMQIQFIVSESREELGPWKSGGSQIDVLRSNKREKEGNQTARQSVTLDGNAKQTGST